MKRTLSINIHYVRTAGSVSAAIVAAVEKTDTIACGVQGRPYNGDDAEIVYARRALEGEDGMMFYIDEGTGLVATLEEGESADDSELSWSLYSVVELVVPSEEDALLYPAALGQMVRALETHGHRSKALAWEDLIKDIRAAAEELADD